MNIIKKLIDGVSADVDLLRSLDEKGDDFSQFRPVIFLFRCKTKENAELISGFLADYKFAKTTLLEDDGEFRVEASVDMPITQNVVNSVSGFMTIISVIYESEFDGWSCKLVRSK